MSSSTDPVPARYIVVDEIYDGTSTLLITGWPTHNERGWLEFPDDQITAVMPLQDLQAAAEGIGWERGPMRESYVMCALVEPAALARTPDQPQKWLVHLIADVTDAARREAEAAFLAAVSAGA